MSRVVKHLVEVLLVLRILELVEDAPDLPVGGFLVVMDSHCELLQVFLILSHALSLRLKFLVEFVELVLESNEALVLIIYLLLVVLNYARCIISPLLEVFVLLNKLTDSLSLLLY